MRGPGRGPRPGGLRSGRLQEPERANRVAAVPLGGVKGGVGVLEELGGSQGQLGYPTSDETTNAEGQKQTTFQHGTVTWTEGADQAVVAGG